MMIQGEHPRHPGVRDPALLGTVERYFVEIMPIPRLAQRIHCFALTRTLAPTVQRVRTHVFAPHSMHCTTPNPACLV